MSRTAHGGHGSGGRSSRSSCSRCCGCRVGGKAAGQPQKACRPKGPSFSQEGRHAEVHHSLARKGASKQPAVDSDEDEQQQHQSAAASQLPLRPTTKYHAFA